MKGPQWKQVLTASCAILGIIIYVTSLSVIHVFILLNKVKSNQIIQWNGIAATGDFNMVVYSIDQ